MFRRKEVRRSPLRVLSAVAASAAVVFGVLAVATPAFADEWQPYSTMLVGGSSWMVANGGGVDAYSNGAFNYVSNDYTAPAVGMRWQCVELAQRLYQAKGWDPSGLGALWGVDAVNIYGLTGFDSHPNDGSYTPVPGD